MLRRIVLTLIVAMTCALLFSCSHQVSGQQESGASSSGSMIVNQNEAGLQLSIDGTVVPAIWEDNAAVRALRMQVAEGDVTVAASPYGGFEQVGSLGRSYPAQDAQTITQCGDIMLYAGSNIVVFTGTNTWAYTRLGVIDLPDSQICEMLDRDSVTLELSLS